MPRFTDTIAALATPMGTSAIALLRISGSDTQRLAAEIFGATPPPRLARHGDYRDTAGRTLDDTVFVFMPGPRSYTGEDTLEISCHGNPFIAQKILEDLLRRGCRAAEPGEFTQRAFLNGRMDLSQAEAVMDLIHARSERALASAHRQLRGALRRRAEAAVEELLGVIARVEAYIDFPEEDLPAEDVNLVTAGLQRVRAMASNLLATSHYGEILRDGIKTVIVGEPNVGKSSLLNRLVGRERALVSSEPGTTRDYLEEPIALGSHYLRLIDTAGLNPSPGPLERLGIEKTRERLEEADLFLWVVDQTGPTPSLPSDIEGIANAENTILILNKCDLGGEVGVGALPYPSVRVSAKTGEGIDVLCERIAALADRFQAEVGEDQVAINARHAAALTTVMDAIVAALAKLEHGEAAELLASDLRTALRAWEEIAGRVDNERMLDALFASFCIGK